MTVLCAMRGEDGSVAFAADSQVSRGDLQYPAPGGKIWRYTVADHDWLFAATGSVRAGQVTQYTFTPPHGDTSDLMRYLVTTAIPALREGMKIAGAQVVRDSRESANIGLLLATQGRIFTVASDYSVCELGGGYWADGSGGDFALGAMHHAVSVGGASPKDVVTAGVAAAIEFSRGCGGPIKVEQIEATS